MCGIAGVYSASLSADCATKTVSSMTGAMAHRGPDDSGLQCIVSDCGVLSLGHRRLSILDLSAAGHQPMAYAGGRIIIVFNGEIYNYIGLRDKLTSEGFVFKSGTDTEVILAAYSSWGESSFRLLRGIYAFALYDRASGVVYLVRDQLGVKPLYYSNITGGVVFASEVRALLASDLVARRCSPEAIAGYLRFGSVQEPNTIIQNVFSVPPGGVIKYRDPVTYEMIARESEVHAHNIEDSCPKTIDLSTLMVRAVTSQLVADVPVGIFLSGGLDSSLIASIAARYSSRKPITFCVGSRHPKYDESGPAAHTAKLIGTEHHMVLLDEDEVLSSIKGCLKAYDQPSYDGVNTYLICKYIDKIGIKVALSGLGADELFAGYNCFYKSRHCYRLGGVLEHAPKALRKLVSAIVGKVYLPGHNTGTMIQGLADYPDSPYYSARALFSEQTTCALLPGFIGLHSHFGVKGIYDLKQRHLRALYPDDSLNQISALELNTYMLSTLLRDSDQMSMASHIELRVPYLDQDLVEAVQRLSSREKVGSLYSSKLLLRSLAAEYLPVEVLNRPKVGFTLPFEVWFRGQMHGELSSFFQQTSHCIPWDASCLRKLWASFNRGKIGWARVYSVYILEQWLRVNRVTV